MIIDFINSLFIEHVKQGGLLVLTSHQHIELDGVETVRIQLGN